MSKTNLAAGNGQPVLVVEDDEICATVIEEMLDLLGYSSVVVHSAEAGEVAFRDRRPRAVITDNMMPGKDGFWLASRVRQHDPVMPLIMLAAAPPHEALSVCSMVLRKPMRITDLRDALSRLGVLP